MMVMLFYRIPLNPGNVSIVLKQYCDLLIVNDDGVDDNFFLGNDDNGGCGGMISFSLSDLEDAIINIVIALSFVNLLI